MCDSATTPGKTPAGHKILLALIHLGGTPWEDQANRAIVELNALVAERDKLIKALIVAKCARWALGTCVNTDIPESQWCVVCKILDDLGYEPHVISEGGLQSWKEK